MFNQALLLSSGGANELKAGMKISGLNYKTELGGNVVLGTGGTGSSVSRAGWKVNSSDKYGGIQLIASSGSGASFTVNYSNSERVARSYSTSEKDYIASAKVSVATLTEIQITNPGTGYKDVSFRLNAASFYLPNNTTYLDSGKYTFNTHTIDIKK